MLRFPFATLLAGALLLTCSQTLFGQKTTEEYRTSDGGTRQTLESIFVPPIAHAPFSLTLETEWSRPLNGGGSFTLTNHRHIKRDSAGRIYQERWILVPKGGKVESTMNWIQIADPARHIYYNCDVANKICTPLPYGDSTTKVYKPQIGTSGQLPDGEGFQNHEDLGTGNLQGLTTLGYRDTKVINPGVFGNDQPMTTTREFWYSPKLGINLLSTLDSPQAGKQVFTVTEISTDEPDPKFFTIPEGYSVANAHEDAKPQR